MSIDREGEDVRFAATFCSIGVAFSVYRSLSSAANARAIILLVFLSTYSHTLSSNTTLQGGRRADWPTESTVV